MWPFSRKQHQAQVSVLTTSIPVARTPTPAQQPAAVPQPLVSKAPTAVIAPPSHAIDVRAEAIKSVIAAGEFFEGNLHFQHGVKIDGRVQGNINFGINDGLLVLNENGHVEGNITGPRAIIVGEVYGNIIVAGKLIILPRARIHGDIAAGTLQIMEGSTINGRIRTVNELERLKTLDHQTSQPQVDHGQNSHPQAPDQETAVFQFSVAKVAKG